MSYTIIHFQDNYSDKKVDTSIIVLYDEYEEHFYLYGTRGTKYEKYIPYAYSYHYSELDKMIYFIKMVNPKYVTMECNHVYIPERDIDVVDYHYLKRKINRNNEIIAYDSYKLKTKKLKKTLSNLFLRGPIHSACQFISDSEIDDCNERCSNCDCQRCDCCGNSVYSDE